MFGAILGDIIGSRFEFDRGGKRKDFRLFTSESGFTDDTVMTIAVGDALMKSGPDADEKEVKENLVKSMQFWGRKYPDAGYGRNFSHWVFSDNPEPYGSWGNGSAMRVSCAGWLYPTLERTLEVAGWTAEVTHNHPEGIKGAKCTAAVIYLSRAGKGKTFIRNYVVENFGYDINTTVNEFRKKHRHDESCMDSLPKALVSFFEGNSYEDVVRNAVSLGGDTDTLAAIAGAMAEAYYGIKEDLKKECYRRVTEDMKNVLDGFTVIQTKTTHMDIEPEDKRNGVIEYIASMIFERKSAEDMLVILCDELIERCLDKGEASTPCIDVNHTIQKIKPENLKTEDEIELHSILRLRVETMKNEKGEIYVPLFTSYEEISKGEASSIRINWPIQSLIEDALNREDVSGLVINPFSSKVVLNKEILEIVLNALKTKEKNK